MSNWRDVISTDSMLLRVINGFRAVCTQSYDEMNKKRGVQWEASRLVSLATGVTSTSLIKTGALPVELKSRSFGYDGLGLTASIFKAPTVTANGTLVASFNFKTSVTTQPLTQLFIGPTVTSNGTKCGADIFAIGPASNQARGSSLRDFPGNRILEPNTTYLLTFTNTDTSTQNISARLEFYEGNFDVPNTDFPS